MRYSINKNNDSASSVYSVEDKRFENIKKIASKVEFVKHSFKNQFCVLNCACCCKKTENDILIQGLNVYHKHILDIKTVIKLHNDMSLLKSLIMTSSQRGLFDILSNMKNAKDLLLYENISGEYDEFIDKEHKEVDYSKLLIDEISLLEVKSSLEDSVTAKLINMFQKKISDHYDGLSRRRANLMGNGNGVITK